MKDDCKKCKELKRDCGNHDDDGSLIDAAVAVVDIVSDIGSLLGGGSDSSDYSGGGGDFGGGGASSDY